MCFVLLLMGTSSLKLENDLACQTWKPRGAGGLALRDVRGGAEVGRRCQRGGGCIPLGVYCRRRRVGRGGVGGGRGGWVRGRNTAEELTLEQIQEVYGYVEGFEQNPSDYLIARGPSLYSDMMDKVLIGPDAFPAAIPDGSIMSQLSARAAVAHETGHLISSRMGVAFAAGSSEDEAFASFIAKYLHGLTPEERNRLYSR